MMRGVESQTPASQIPWSAAPGQTAARKFTIGSVSPPIDGSAA
jgi:hypothetical protein